MLISEETDESVNLFLVLQAMLFNPAKPFFRGTGSQNADVELMTDCFVSCFRINPHNNQHFKVFSFSFVCADS